MGEVKETSPEQKEFREQEIKKKTLSSFSKRYGMSFFPSSSYCQFPWVLALYKAIASVFNYVC